MAANVVLHMWLIKFWFHGMGRDAFEPFIGNVKESVSLSVARHGVQHVSAQVLAPLTGA